MLRSLLNFKPSLELIILILLSSVHSNCFAQYKANTLPIIASVNAFIKSLDKDQQLSFQKKWTQPNSITWSNLPLDDVHRDGLPISGLPDESKIILNQILRQLLSEAGYLKCVLIRMYDDVTNQKLAKINNPIAYKYGFDNYWVSLYGNTSDASGFTFQFEGHHFSLTVLITKNSISFSQLFVGINPSTTKEGKYAGLSIMLNEQAIADSLILSLHLSQLQTAIIGDYPIDADIMVRNNDDFAQFSQLGLPITSMDSLQKNMVYSMIATWVSNLNNQISSSIISKYTNPSQNIKFLWKGSTEANALHYFAIKGNDFVIEFSTRDGGTQHFHTSWFEKR